MKKNIILSSFKESFQILKKNKEVFLVLFLLQLLFFSSMFFVNLYYQPKIMDNVINVMEYISKQNPEEGENILGEDPLMIHRNYESMVYNLRLLSIWCFFIFVLVNGSMFYLTSKLIYDKKFSFKGCFRNCRQNTKEFFVYLFKFGIASLISFSLIFSSLYSVFKGSLFSLIESIDSFNPGSLLIAVVLAYFMYLTFSLIYKIKIKNIFKELVNIGLKKAHIILLAYLINLIVVNAFFLLTAFLIEINIVLISLIVLLLMLSFVWSKIFLVGVVEKLS